MSTWLSLAILIIAIAAYGYWLPRRVSQRYYTAANLIFGLAAVGFGKLAGASWANLGFKASLGRLLYFACILVTAGLGILIIYKSRGLKLARKDRLELFVRIPFGTALSEELIFRSSLMGILLQTYSRMAALIVSSIAFGFWHILPNTADTWAHQKINPKVNVGAPAMLLSSGSTVLFTAAGGLLFGGLRLLSGSILFPWAAHTATNGIGWILDRPTPRKGIS